MLVHSCALFQGVHGGAHILVGLFCGMSGWPLCFQWEMPDFKRICFIYILICSLRLVDAIKTTSVELNSPVSAAALQQAERVKRTQCREVF